MNAPKDQFEILKDQLTNFLKERKWIKYHTPKNVAMSLAIEAAELMEIFQWEDPSIEEVINNEETLSRVEDELADILIYAISLARALNIDISSCINVKMTKNNERFPPNNTKQD
ncbi:MAG: nucleotide pyrophosphohydrolase [Asgard group archaeon]|nr:nucleotide pyrophosphohydrolase [Asgard group archaeon]